MVLRIVLVIGLRCLLVIREIAVIALALEMIQDLKHDCNGFAARDADFDSGVLEQSLGGGDNVVEETTCLHGQLFGPKGVEQPSIEHAEGLQGGGDGFAVVGRVGGGAARDGNLSKEAKQVVGGQVGGLRRGGDVTCGGQCVDAL